MRWCVCIITVIICSESCCFVGYCFQDLFNIARSIHVQFPSRIFFIRFVSVYGGGHSNSRIDTTAP